jgi:tetratricopeptide (TPR) repeat protein
MAKRRITRKAIKKKDEFQTRAEKITGWVLEQGWMKVTFFLVGIAVMIMLVIGVGKLTENKNADASYMYSKAFKIYSEAAQPVEGEFIQNEEKLKKAVKSFDEVIENSGSSFYTDMAGYYRLQCLFKLGDEDKALKAGLALFDDTSEDIIRNQLGFFLADKYIQIEKYEEARAIYEELESNMNSKLNPNELHYKSGLLYEKVSKINEATAEYMKIIDNNDQMAFRREAEQRLSLVNPKALEEKRKQR